MSHDINNEKHFKLIILILKKLKDGGFWVVESVTWLVLGFSSDGDLRVVGSSPPVGHCAESGVCLGFSLPLPVPLPLVWALSLKQIN